MANVVHPGHSADTVSPQPTVNHSSMFGFGRLSRRDANMLPVKPATLTRGGRTVIPWSQSRAVESKQGVLPKTRSLPVLVKSANNDSNGAQVGTPVQSWGIAGMGSAPDGKAMGQKLLAVGILGVAAYFIFFKQ